MQDLLKASAGMNLGVDFLPGALDLDATAFDVDADFAGRVLWFDALVSNVDRSWRNPNMLFWHGRPYLIDHGATLTFHHNWAAADASVARPYDATAHALLGCSPDIDAAETALAGKVTGDLLRAAVAAVPDEWLACDPHFDSTSEAREAYVATLEQRWHARGAWLDDLRGAVAGHDGSARAATPERRTRPSWLGSA